MSICVVTKVVGSVDVLALSTVSPCDGMVFVESADLIGQLGPTEVGVLFSACVALYALSFVFKMALRQMGFGK